MLSTFSKQIVLAFSLTILAGTAQALPFDFSYDFGGNVLSGVLEGELQDDGDTIIVSELSMLEFSGYPGLDFYTEIAVTRNIATLSGLNVELATRLPTPGDLSSLAGFGLTTVILPIRPGGLRLAIFESGGIFQESTTQLYDPTRWSITPAIAAIPTPAPIGLLVLSLVLMRRFPR